MKKLLIAIVLISNLFAENISVEISHGRFENFAFNSVGLLAANLRIKNIGSKPIKYIDIEMNYHNRVGDKLYPKLGNETCRVTGPIEVGNTKKIQLECGAYYDGYSDSGHLMVRAVNVVYMDGTENNIPTEYFKHTNNFEQSIQDGLIFGVGGGLLGGVLLMLLLGIL